MKLRGVWTTEELNHMEKVVIDLTYIQAFLYLTVNEEFPCKWAIEWLYDLADKYPESRLACHIKRVTPPFSAKIG